MAPGDWIYWHHVPRGGYGLGYYVPALVVAVLPKRVRIEVEKANGRRVYRDVKRESLRPTIGRYSREEALAWSLQGEPAPSVLAWGSVPLSGSDSGDAGADEIPAVSGSDSSAINSGRIDHSGHSGSIASGQDTADHPNPAGSDGGGSKTLAAMVKDRVP